MDKKSQSIKIHGSHRKIGIGAALLVIFSAAMLLGTTIMRGELIQNARDANMLLLDNYITDEENKLETFRTTLALGTKFIDEKELEHASVEEIKSGLYPYLNGFNDLYSGDSIRAIGIVGGKIISNDPDFEDFDDGVFDYTDTVWYKGAMEADGNIYVSNGYSDYTTGKMNFTMAQKVAHSDSILLFDIFFDDYHVGSDALELPEDGAYYLCDGNGVVIYDETQVYDSYDDMQEFADRMLGYMDKGEESEYIKSYTDAKGSVRSAFIGRLNNGWTLILTIPQKNSIGGLGTFYKVIAILFAVGVLLIVFMGYRDLKQQHRNEILVEEQEQLTHTAQLMQRTMNSTLPYYREVYYVDLKTHKYCLVYPEWAAASAATDIHDVLKRHFSGKQIPKEESERTFQFFQKENIAREIRKNGFAEFRCKHIDFNGKCESCSVLITAVDTENGTPVSAALSVRSIEKLLKQEEAQRELLELAAKRAESASHAKSDFLSNMSHDIRTPMNAILGMTAIAEMNIDNKERVKDALKKITLSGKHLLGLINSVLDMSKIESGKINLSEDEFSVIESADNLMSLFHADFERKKIKTAVDVSEITHENVIGDSQRLQQILINIMGNAVKFTPDGGSISLQIAEKHFDETGRSRYKFVFTDTGIGMSEEFCKRIFEPFSRAADSRTTQIEGTGLGMPIALNIAKMMGGDIKVSSKLGEGSQFTVTVYLKTNSVSEEDMKRLANLPVLVVDDEQAAAESACAVLESLDMKAEYVTSGAQAVERIGNAHKAGEDFALVILDLKMPDMNGIDATVKIRELMGRSIPVIILSAYDRSDVEEDAIKAGVDAFIEKPLFKSRLTRALKKVIGSSGKAAGQETEQRRYDGKRVLLAEDNALNTEVATELLSAIGLKIDTAENGREAVKRFKESESGYYDLIFMDIQMPEMNGYEAAAEIRRLEKEDAKSIPIIAMTADAFADDIQRAQQAGMNGHISKPIDIAKIREVLGEKFFGK